MLKKIAPKCGHTVASDFKIVGSVVGGAVSPRQQGLVIASPVKLSSVTDYCRVHLPIIFIKTAIK